MDDGSISFDLWMTNGKWLAWVDSAGNPRGFFFVVEVMCSAVELIPFSAERPDLGRDVLFFVVQNLKFQRKTFLPLLANVFSDLGKGSPPFRSHGDSHFDEGSGWVSVEHGAGENLR